MKVVFALLVLAALCGLHAVNAGQKFGLEVELSSTFMQKQTFTDGKWKGGMGVLKTKAFQHDGIKWTLDDNKNREQACLDVTGAKDAEELIKTGNVKAKSHGGHKDKGGALDTKNKATGQCNYGLVELVSDPQPATAAGLANHLTKLKAQLDNFNKKGGKDVVVAFPLGSLFSGGEAKTETSSIQYSQGIKLSQVHDLPNKALGQYGWFQEQLAASVKWAAAAPSPIADQKLKNFLALWHWSATKLLRITNAATSIGKNMINPSPKINFCREFWQLKSAFKVPDEQLKAAKDYMLTFDMKDANDFKKTVFKAVATTPEGDRKLSIKTAAECAYVSSDNTLVEGEKDGDDLLLVFEFRAYMPGHPVFDAIKDVVLDGAKVTAESPKIVKAVQYMDGSLAKQEGATKIPEKVHEPTCTACTDLPKQDWKVSKCEEECRVDKKDGFHIKNSCPSCHCNAKGELCDGAAGATKSKFFFLQEKEYQSSARVLRSVLSPRSQ